MEHLAQQIDAISANQQETLASWVADARAYGDTPAQKAEYARHAKAIVTIWGGTGHLSDYASRAWAGLYAGYYLPRWQMMLEAQRAAALSHQKIDEAATIARIRDWERQWVEHGRVDPTPPPSRPLQAARALLDSIAP